MFSIFLVFDPSPPPFEDLRQSVPVSRESRHPFVPAHRHQVIPMRMLCETVFLHRQFDQASTRSARHLRLAQVHKHQMCAARQYKRFASSSSYCRKVILCVA